MNISLLNRLPRDAEERPSDQTLLSAAREAIGVGVQVRERLWQRMARECEAMTQHALSTGRVISVEVMERLDQAVSAPDTLVAVAALDRHDDGSRADAATASTPAIAMSRFVSLAVAHAGLALAIAPATPEAVLLMADERDRHPVRSGFGPLPVVRQMLGLALFSLLVLLGVSLSADVNAANMSRSLLELSGYSLFMIEAFLVSAASLGSCFANLQRINAVISEGTYDPRVQSTYWTRWVMGVISGIVLSQIVYDFLLHSGSDTTVKAVAVPAAIGQPILALLGGYSVDFVHGILRRAINTVGNFFGVSGDEPVESQKRARIAEALAPERLNRASALVDLQRATAQNPDADEIRRRLEGMSQPIAVKAG